MLTLKTEASEDLAALLAFNTVSAAEELENWTRLEFGEMDRRESKPNNRNPPRSRTHSTSTSTSANESQPMDANGIQDAALLAQFAAAAGNANMDYSNMLSQNSYPSMGPTPGFYGTFMHHNTMPPPQLPPLSSLNFPWHSMMPPPEQTHYDPHHASSSTINSFMDTGMGSMSAPTTSRGDNPSRRDRQAQPSSSTQPRNQSTSPEVEQTEAERLAMSDEKRRRNTAASARFRIKKKHKTITLERSVSELTGRAEDLEREAADLRRENGWLKEIVMLKGTRFAASNLAHQQALRAAALGAQEAGPSVSGSEQREEESASEQESESSEEEEVALPRKGKGKSQKKDTKK